jgi:hypothetical protein
MDQNKLDQGGKTASLTVSNYLFKCSVLSVESSSCVSKSLIQSDLQWIVELCRFIHAAIPRHGGQVFGRKIWVSAFVRQGTKNLAFPQLLVTFVIICF